MIRIFLRRCFPFFSFYFILIYEGNKKSFRDFFPLFPFIILFLEGPKSALIVNLMIYIQKLKKTTKKVVGTNYLFFFFRNLMVDSLRS